MTTNDPTGAGGVGTRTRNEHEANRPGDGHGQYRTDEQAVRADDRRDPIERRDRARWGPVWAGALITLPVFFVLQSFFFAVGWLDLGIGTGVTSTAASIVSAILGLIAFFIGGLAAAAFAMWRGMESGLLQGILVWALATVGIIFLSLLGGGALLGSLADVVTQLGSLQQLQGSGVNPAQVLGTVREAAGWSALWLGLTALTAALGGLAGSKIWPSKRSGRTVDDR